MPGVGATVSNPPSELTLVFTQEIVPAFSNVRVSGPGGEAVAASKATVDSGNPTILHVRLSRALRPGTYTVSWHVVSIDTHPTSGTYHFTVAP
jgi:methionine-rich copper-binding protein CopC